MSVNVIELLTEIVKEKGEDYVYTFTPPHGSTPRCAYTTQEGKPSCLIGIMLGKVAPQILELINKMEWNPLRGPVGRVDSLHSIMRNREDWPFEDDDIPALSAAQNAQDYGEPYGSVLRQIQPFYSRH